VRQGIFVPVEPLVRPAQPVAGRVIVGVQPEQLFERRDGVFELVVEVMGVAETASALRVVGAQLGAAPVGPGGLVVLLEGKVRGAKRPMCRRHVGRETQSLATGCDRLLVLRHRKLKVAEMLPIGRVVGFEADRCLGCGYGLRVLLQSAEGDPERVAGGVIGRIEPEGLAKRPRGVFVPPQVLESQP
jgi:hypothetical protein